MSEHTLYVSVPMAGFDPTIFRHITNRVTTIATNHGGKFSGSGFGFGQRDLDFYFEGPIPAQAIREIKEEFPGAVFKVIKEDGGETQELAQS